MRGDLGDLRIDRFARHPDNSRHSPLGWAMAALATGVLTGCGYVLYAKLIPSQEVQVVRLRAAESSTAVQDNIVLSATGYVIAAHKIDVASKVMGRAAWVGVEKGDVIRQGQVLVRLEDDEYRAKVLEAQGQLESARARLTEVERGSRPEDIRKAGADLDQGRAELNNARATLERTRALVREGVLARQVLDDAQTRHDVQMARAMALESAYDLVRLGPRQEQIEALRAQV